MESVVTMRSSDGEMFEAAPRKEGAVRELLMCALSVERTVALESETVKNMIEDTGVDNPIPLPNVSHKILAKARSLSRLLCHRLPIGDRVLQVPCGCGEEHRWQANSG
mgnify:CR=1 FL=1